MVKGKKGVEVLIGLILMLILSGCQGILEHSEREALDHQKTLQVAQLRILVVRDQICFMKGLGRAEELPANVVTAMDEFMVLTEDPNSMNDCELVYSLGFGARFYEAVLLNVFPEFRRFWP